MIWDYCCFTHHLAAGLPFPPRPWLCILSSHYIIYLIVDSLILIVQVRINWLVYCLQACFFQINKSEGVICTSFLLQYPTLFLVGLFFICLNHVSNSLIPTSSSFSICNGFNRSKVFFYLFSTRDRSLI